ncbi:MAG: SpaH/EbpB family LPXTG-anchored major pilin [Propionicimonas sp.]|uniref:SpaH/EbpB family LPXTG-anchored major pilin n=1 Tax=Propionicimonas sp. TaxID=1955623 RepID=UPI002B1F488F|nr:SpaH/EbpB family LPXTG-anchored major pilin [Propionicimonas sp.]MEA4945582.1 SpaH/EbpB family LPXTG-anchored major pilin [Propionicimonas sp.]MEA5052303.1 SpaH/EbpB family LPXTG-anchored major pilin [Propionicimonas sp.]
MNITMTPLQRFAAGAAALALAAIGAVSTATPANAAPGPGQSGAPDTGSLIVHKRAGVQGGATTALADVTFSLQRVGVWTGGSCVAIDLTTTAGWTAAQAANGTNPAAPVSPASEGAFCASGAATDGKTNASGEYTFGNLALGLYYVAETDAPANVVERSVPFYVTVPYPSGTASNWLYNVDVYPKNAVADRPVKTISSQPSSLVVGSTVQWTITQTIPSLTSTTASFTEASVTDALDSRLSLSGAPVVTIGSPNGAQLTAADYTVSGAVTITFTGTGLAKLTANQTKTLTVTLTTTVGSVGNGSIPNNGAAVSFNGKPQTPAAVPYSYWGQLTVTKVDASDDTILLSGARFALHEKGAGTCPATPTGNVVATGTSNATGVVQWDSSAPASPLGLWIANSDTPAPDSAKDYCLYETQAPSGYVRITDPWTVTLEATDGGVAVAVTAENQAAIGPDLPLTGAQGTLLFTLAGLALVALATGGLLVRRARANH